VPAIGRRRPFSTVSNSSEGRAGGEATSRPYQLTLQNSWNISMVRWAAGTSPSRQTQCHRHRPGQEAPDSLGLRRHSGSRYGQTCRQQRPPHKSKPTSQTTGTLTLGTRSRMARSGGDPDHVKSQSAFGHHLSRPAPIVQPGDDYAVRQPETNLTEPLDVDLDAAAEGPIRRACRW